MHHNKQKTSKLRSEDDRKDQARTPGHKLLYLEAVFLGAMNIEPMVGTLYSFLAMLF